MPLLPPNPTPKPTHILQALAGLIISGDITHPPTLAQFIQSHLPSPSIAHLPLPPLLPLLPTSITFLHNTLIRHSPPSESLHAFIRMLRFGVSVDNFTLPFALHAAARRRHLPEGAQVHGQVERRGFGADVYVVNNLIRLFSAVGEMGLARKVFDFKVGCVDVVSWNTMVDGYVKAGELEAARRLFGEMPVKNAVSWSAMVGGYAGKGELEVAVGLFEGMPVDGRNVVTWNSMVSGFARHGCLSSARKLFDSMPVRNVVSWNTMVAGYAVNGKMDLARELFEKMDQKDVFSWSCMISGYAQCGCYKEALHLFSMMQMENRVMPNEVTLGSVLSACAHLAALDQGKWVHAFVEKNQMTLDDDDNLGAALVDMYAKCGCVNTATEVFWNLGHRNVSAWNALITGLAVNGLARESLDIFEKMQSSGTRPNDVTYVGVLTACTHGGFVDEGRGYFENMSKIHKIMPAMIHYGCVVDLLGRSGFLSEAERTIRDMPMKPDVMIFGALLGACKVYKNVEIAHRLRDDFLELKPREAGCYILLSNIYAAAGMWTEASEMRTIMKRNHIRKIPGYSLIEMDGTVHEFVAGDRSHPQTAEIYSWLDEMSLKFRSEGYVPATEDVLMDLSEEDKETWLFRHSEKLAIAFAMLRTVSTHPYSTIRIVKNLRICRDCHSFIKHVSRTCSHHILVRDHIRFHHFKDGSCSCNDFW